MPADFNDPRWGGYVPWFLRQSDFSARGNFPTFFSRLSQRLQRLFKFNECNVYLMHFGPLLETESLQRFRSNATETLDENIRRYFDPDTLEYEARSRIYNDGKLRQMEQAVGMLELGARPSNCNFCRRVEVVVFLWRHGQNLS
jgi:hypothetical protein